MTVSIGIDVAEARKGIDLVGLESDRSVVESLGRLTPDEIVRIVQSIQPAVVCIDSPSGWSMSGKSRLAERELAAIGIQSYRTGADPGPHPFYGWVRGGMELYARLTDSYPVYRGGEVAGSAAEIFPHATAALLAGSLGAAGQGRSSFVERRFGAMESQRRIYRPQTGSMLRSAPSPVWSDLRAVTASQAIRMKALILLPVRSLPRSPLRKKGSTSVTPARSQPKRASVLARGTSVRLGYVNRNNQEVIEATGLPGTDHGQSIYVLRCRLCGSEYGSNGSDNFQRKCPGCQQGRPGLRLK